MGAMQRREFLKSILAIPAAVVGASVVAIRDMPRGLPPITTPEEAYKTGQRTVVHNTASDPVDITVNGTTWRADGPVTIALEHRQTVYETTPIEWPDRVKW